MFQLCKFRTLGKVVNTIWLIFSVQGEGGPNIWQKYFRKRWPLFLLKKYFFLSKNTIFCSFVENVLWIFTPCPSLAWTLKALNVLLYLVMKHLLWSRFISSSHWPRRKFYHDSERAWSVLGCIVCIIHHVLVKFRVAKISLMSSMYDIHDISYLFIPGPPVSPLQPLIAPPPPPPSP